MKLSRVCCAVGSSLCGTAFGSTALSFVCTCWRAFCNEEAGVGGVPTSADCFCIPCAGSDFATPAWAAGGVEASGDFSARGTFGGVCLIATCAKSRSSVAALSWFGVALLEVEESASSRLRLSFSLFSMACRPSYCSSFVGFAMLGMRAIASPILFSIALRVSRETSAPLFACVPASRISVSASVRRCSIAVRAPSVSGELETPSSNDCAEAMPSIALVMRSSIFSMRAVTC